MRGRTAIEPPGGKAEMPFEDLPLKPAVSDVDRHIGARLRGRRTMLRMSVEALAVRVGIDPAAYDRYETGIERIPAATLFDVSGVLRVPVRFVFDHFVAAPGAAKLWADHPVLPAAFR